MNTNISTIQKIETYLNQRFNLSDEILNEIASEIYIANHGEGAITIRYLKKTDMLCTKRWSFNVQWWLSQNFTQCACCGQWYRENLAGNTIFSTSIFTIYDAKRGCDRDFHVCNVCTMLDNTATQLEDTVSAYEQGFVSFAEAFRPTTHVKS